MSTWKDNEIHEILAIGADAWWSQCAVNRNTWLLHWNVFVMFYLLPLLTRRRPLSEYLGDLLLLWTHLTRSTSCCGLNKWKAIPSCRKTASETKLISSRTFLLCLTLPGTTLWRSRIWLRRPSWVVGAGHSQYQPVRHPRAVRSGFASSLTSTFPLSRDSAFASPSSLW